MVLMTMAGGRESRVGGSVKIEDQIVLKNQILNIAGDFEHQPVSLRRVENQINIWFALSIRFFVSSWRTGLLLRCRRWPGRQTAFAPHQGNPRSYRKLIQHRKLIQLNRAAPVLSTTNEYIIPVPSSIPRRSRTACRNDSSIRKWTSFLPITSIAMPLAPILDQ